MKHVLLPVFLVLFSCLCFAGSLEILEVRNVSALPGAIYAGDIITLNFDVKNISGTGQVAEDVSVSTSLNENYFNPIIVSERLGTIKSGATKTVSLRFKAKDSVLAGAYRVPAIISYSNQGSMTTQSSDLDFSISSCHVLKVDGIKLSDESPHIGDKLSIAAVVNNVCNTSARNVVVELKPVTNPTVAPFLVTSGTIRRLGDIEPNGFGKVDFDVVVSDKVDAKAYVFSLDANCDECGRPFQNSFSFLVLGKPELVFSNVEYSVDDAKGGAEKHILAGAPFTLSIQLDNIGKEKAKAVEVAVQFDSDIVGTSRAFLGNINVDDSGAGIFNLSPKPSAKPGEHKGKVTVAYLDESGVRQQFSQDYSVYVNEQPPTSPVVYIVILALLLAVLGAVYLILKFVFRQLAIRKSQSR